ncbi:MAG TPA: FtsX-like permease family protein, partial [Rhodothermales bacterium]|nr:FtsX-like permease family protein [Rhodothermales bacterium]
QLDFALPMAEFVARNTWVEDWDNNGLRLYVRLRKGTNVAAFDAKLAAILRANKPEGYATAFLQPFGEQHLYGQFENGQVVGGRIEYVRAFAIAAGLILLLACINFMNLATARAAMRAREVGVRKAIGAARAALVGQFLGEAVLVALLAAVVAAGLVVLALPAFGTLTGKPVEAGALGAGALWPLFAIAAGAGLLAGSYPALYLSGFGVARVLRGAVQPRGGAGLRKALIVFQFAMSMLLLVATSTVHRQVGFIRSKHLGLNRAGVVSLPLEGPMLARYDALRQELLRQPGIEHVTTADQNPLELGSSTRNPTWDGKEPGTELNFYIVSASHGFVEAMQMGLAAGRSFDPARPADTLGFLVNETAVRAMGLKDPIGARLSFWERDGTIIGVVKDFHMASLDAPIEPTIIRLTPPQGRLFVRLDPVRAEQALAGLRAVQQRFNPGHPFEAEFLDDSFERMYVSERRVGALANVFAGLAVFIACLGLFGLAAFTAERRTKEVGIRKVLGASVPRLVGLLSKDFVALVALAFVLAAPVAYWLGARWLEGFTYRVALGAGPFVLAGLVALGLALVAVSSQALRAATADPVKALRTE